jgi:translocation and assembly module TamB
MAKIRRLRTWFFAATLLIAAVAAIALAARSEAALRWAAERAIAWSGGRLDLVGVSGSVLGPLRVTRLRYRAGDTIYEAEGVEADWDPLSALAGPIRLNRLGADQLTVRVQHGGPPPRLPEDIGCPIEITLQGIALKRIVVRTADAETPIEDVAGNASLGPGGYAVSLSSARFAWGRIGGEAMLAAARPFRLSGHINAAPTGLEGKTVAVTLGGTLESVEAAAVLDLAWGSARARVAIAPLADQVVRGLKADIKGLDPAQARSGLPEADIEASLDLSAEDGAISGALEVVNRRPGRFDQNRLPLTAATARLSGTLAAPLLDPFVVKVAGGAELRGSARLRADRAEAVLNTPGISLQELHGALKAIRLAGQLNLDATLEQQTLVAELGSGAYRLSLDATHQGSRLELRSAALRARGSELLLQGQVALDGERAFTARGMLRQFNPAQWGDFPAARVNAQLDAAGRLAPKTEATLRYRIVDSSYRQAPLAGNGSVGRAADGSVHAEGDLALAENRATFTGAFGRPGDRLAWTLEAPRLASLGTEFGGRLSGTGWIGGSPKQPELEFDLRGSNVRFADVTAASIDAKAKIEASRDGALTARLAAADLKAGAIAVASLEGEVAGSVARHTVSLDARGPALEFRARAEGEFSQGPRWTGTVLSLESQRPYALRLSAPARLELAPAEVRVSAAEVVYAGGRIVLEEFHRRPGLLDNRGHFSGLPLAVLLPHPAGTPWESTLTLGGAWDVQAADHLRGFLRIAREQGDIVLTGARTVPLGLTVLALDAKAQDASFEATVTAEGKTLGTLRGSLEARAEHTENGWRIERDAPLRGEFKASMPSIAWLGPLADPLLATAGAIELDASVSGNVRTPVLKGQLSGHGLEAHVDTVGLHLVGGTLDGGFGGDRLEVRELRFRGGQGMLTATGFATFSEDERNGLLQFSADKLAMVALPDQKLVVSGSGRVELEGKRVAISGALRADEGLIQLRGWDRPRLSDDVVITGRETRAPVAATSALRLALDLNLGDSFVIRGTGLDAHLQGNIALNSDTGVTRAKGVVRVVEGSYTAYGQQLAVESGSLLFDGPITNPALDIVALRKNQKVEAGVAITGTALSPRVRLVSRPDVPDSEKLSWLVLGQGTGGTEESPFTLPGFTTRKADYASVGTQLTSSLHVGIGRSLLGTGTLLKLTYILSNTWSVRASSGDVNGLSVLYTISFE